MMACAADLEYREKRRFNGGNGSDESGYKEGDKPRKQFPYFGNTYLAQQLDSCEALDTVYQVTLKHCPHINRLRRIQSTTRNPFLKLCNVDRGIGLVRAVKRNPLEQDSEKRREGGIARATHKFLNPRFGNNLVIGV